MGCSGEVADIELYERRFFTEIRAHTAIHRRSIIESLGVPVDKSSIQCPVPYATNRMRKGISNHFARIDFFDMADFVQRPVVEYLGYNELGVLGRIQRIGTHIPEEMQKRRDVLFGRHLDNECGGEVADMG